MLGAPRDTAGLFVNLPREEFQALVLKPIKDDTVIEKIILYTYLSRNVLSPEEAKLVISFIDQYLSQYRNWRFLRIADRRFVGIGQENLFFDVKSATFVDRLPSTTEAITVDIGRLFDSAKDELKSAK